MPTVAQGISKVTAIAKQVALGTPFTGAGGQELRRTSFIPQAQRDTFENNEIRKDQQSPGVVFGLKKTNGKLSGLLSPATYKLLFASALRKDFAAGATTGALIVVTAATTSGVQGTFTRSSGSYLTDGFKIGDVVRWTGWAGGSATNNNNSNMLIIALTATVMTVTRFDAVAIANDAAGDSVTCTVVGKKSVAPLTGHTNDYFTFEDWYADISKSEIYNDVKLGQIDVNLPGTGNVTFSADLLGLTRTLGAAQVLTSPTAQTTTPVVSAANGLVMVNGAIVASITGAQLTISGSMQQGDAIVGSQVPLDIQRGRIKVSGQFTALFTDQTLQTLFDNQTVVGLVLVVMDNVSVGTSSFMSFNMSAVKITSDPPDDGEKTIIRTYSFTAGINTAGGAALANDQTILSIQDSDA